VVGKIKRNTHSFKHLGCPCVGMILPYITVRIHVMDLLNKERVGTYPFYVISKLRELFIKLRMLCEYVTICLAAERLMRTKTSYPVFCTFEPIENRCSIVCVHIACIFGIAVKWHGVGFGKDNVDAVIFEL